MISQNEKHLLKIIQYIPTLLLSIISIIIITLLYMENINNFTEQKEEIHKNYILKSKALVKERIDNTYNYIQYLEKNTEKELIKSLKEETNKVYSIINSIYENNKNIKSPEEIKQLISDAIRPIRFNNGRGYFFLHDKKTYITFMHSAMPSIEGKSLFNLQDAKGTHISKLMHEALETQNEATLEWYWYKPGNTKTQYKKIGYVRNFEAYNWLIGTGEYVVDFEKEVQKKVLERIASNKFDKNGYIFVLTYEGKILNYFKKEMINKNIFDVAKFKNGAKLLIEKARNENEGFVTYNKVINHENNIASKKTSYVKGIDNWQWLIGTGFNENDVNKIIQQKKEELDSNILLHMKNTIITSIVLAITLFLLSYFLSLIVNKKIKEYKKEIDTHVQNKIEQEKLLARQTKMAVMGEMIGNIAHQWRQPLSSITSNATTMIVQKQVDVLDEPSLIKGLEEINNKAQFLSSTIDDFRNFYNNDKNTSTFKLRDSVHETLSIISSQLKQNDITIIKNIQEITINNCKNEFMQVLINILNNSRDALKDQKIDKYILINAYENNNSLILTIKDSAGGIEKEIIDKIFEPYFTTKQQFKGTGIGLYMSNEIITQHMRGYIEVTNEEFIHKNKNHMGAMFKITIPLDNK